MKKKTILIIICLILLAICIPLFIYTFNREGNEVYVEEETSITVSNGDVLVVDVEYCFTCGYSMWSPEYDKDVFELISNNDISLAEPGLVGGNYLRTYEFKAKKEAINSNIKLGYYRPFDAENTWTVAKDLYITVK